VSSNFVIGEIAYIGVTIEDGSLALADPGALRLKAKAPDGSVTTQAIGSGVVKDTVGVYHGFIPLNQSGTWSYRWESDAPNAGAVEGTLTVAKSKVA
jgi:hypothetical protein